MKEISIRRRLLMAMLTVSSSVLLLMGLVLMSYEFNTYRQSTARSLTALANTIAANSTAVLVYDDEKVAQEVLSGLASEPDIDTACLFTHDGQLFAWYTREASPKNLPASPGLDGIHFGADELVIAQPVVQGKARLGTLYVKQNLTGMYHRLGVHALVVLIVVAGSVVVALLLSTLFEKRIAHPLLMLAETARRISQHKDFSARAVPARVEELSLLTTAFNEMLTEIQRHQSQLTDELTARRHAEEAMRASREELRFVTDHTSILISHCDRENRFRFVNLPYAARFGLAPENIVGKPIAEVIGDAAFEEIRGYVERALRGEAVQFEIRVPYELLGERWMYATYTPEPPRDGVIHGFVAVIEDVTERHIMQDALRRAHDRLQTALDGMNDSFVIFGRDWRVLMVNPATTRLSGKAVGQMLGANIWETFPELVGTTLYRDYLRSMEQRVPVRLEFYHRPVDRWYESQCYPVEEGLAVFSADITERKKAQELLEATVIERTAQLRETIGELEAFSYSFSHDMRAPLRAISGYAQILLEDGSGHGPGSGQDPSSSGQASGPHATDYLNKILAAASRMNQLMTDVLAYSRVSRAERTLQRVNVEQLIREIIDQYPNLQSPSVDIQIQSPLPDVLGDEASLAQCIANLLTNAVKFVAPGTKPQIHVRAESSGDQVTLWFEDNGIGIPMKDRERIFRMFERVHPSQRYEGTGIGLAIVKKAVERMGGQVGVDSGVDQGSRFWVRLRKG